MKISRVNILSPVPYLESLQTKNSLVVACKKDSCSLLDHYIMGVSTIRSPETKFFYVLHRPKFTVGQFDALS